MNMKVLQKRRNLDQNIFSYVNKLAQPYGDAKLAMIS